MKFNKSLLVISRAGFSSPNGSIYFDKTDGISIDTIAPSFRKIKIISNKVNFNPSSKICYTFQNSNIEIIEKKLKPFKLFLQLYSEIKNIDLLFVYMPFYSSALSILLAKILSVKVIYYSGNDWGDTIEIKMLRKNRNAFLIKIMKTLFRNIDYYIALICDARLMNNCLLYRKLSKKSAKITEKIRPMSFITRESFNNNLEREIKNHVRLLAIGTIIPRKNYQNMIKSLSYLRDIYNIKFTLSIIGATHIDKNYFNSLLHLINDEKLKSVIKFYGFINSNEIILKYINNSDILINTSISEGFPRSAWEAMSQGVPVILPKTDLIQCELTNFPNAAFLVNQNDCHSIAESINLLISNYEMRKEQIKSAFDYLEEIFNETFYEQFIRVAKNLENYN